VKVVARHPDAIANHRKARIAFGLSSSRRNHAIAQPDARPNYPITQLPNYSIRRASGFTVIELMVVLSIIIVLASMGLAQYRNSVLYSSEAVLKQQLTTMRDAIDQYYADKNEYPSTLEALVTDGYLRKLPEDPFTKSTSTWVTIPAEPDPNKPTAVAGIYDVKSGSEGTGLDGKKHSEF
jgi:general secretion pathway protein G